MHFYFSVMETSFYKTGESFMEGKVQKVQKIDSGKSPSWPVSGTSSLLESSASGVPVWMRGRWTGRGSHTPCSVHRGQRALALSLLLIPRQRRVVLPCRDRVLPWSFLRPLLNHPLDGGICPTLGVLPALGPSR